MQYYRVKKQYDQRPIIKQLKSGRYEYVDFLIANELFTPAEYKKIISYSPTYEKCFTPANVSKNKTYVFFGARFEFDTDYTS